MTICGAFFFDAALESKPASSPESVFRMAVVGPIRTLDPALSRSLAEHILLTNLGEPLMVMDTKTGLPIEGSARSAKVSKDGKKVTVKLRKDLFWSNGERLKAEDFNFSLRRLLDPTIQSWFFPMFKNLRGAQAFHDGAPIEPSQIGIEVKAEDTLVFHLEKPDPFFLLTLAHPVTMPVHRKTLDRFKKSWFSPKHWVGNGPFLPVAKNAYFYRLRKNPHHRFSPGMALDEVQISLSPTRSEAVDLFVQGKVDQFGYRDHGVPLPKTHEFVGKGSLRYEPDLRTFFLRLNSAKAPLSQRKIREALAMSLDRGLLVPTSDQSRRPLTLSLVPDKLLGYEAPHGYLYNTPGALGILSDLGYCTRDRSPAGCKHLPPLEIIHRDHSSMRKQALKLQGIWKRALGLQGMRILSYNDEAFEKAISTGKYMMALDDLAVDSERPFDFLKMFHSKQSLSGGVSLPEYDHLLEFAQNTPAWPEARKHFRAAEARLLREALVIPLYHGTTPVLVSPRVRGFVPNLMGVYPFSEISLR